MATAKMNSFGLFAALALAGFGLSACQSDDRPGRSHGSGKSASLRAMEQVTIAAHKCWIASKDPAFKGYSLANELNSFSGTPRFLLVPKNNYGGKPLLVVAGDLAQQLRNQMRHDPLTQVLNRRGLDEAATRAIAQARRHGRALALVVCDLDGFKGLNDSYGHIAGDQALKGFAGLLTLAVRRGDIVGRMGGDEFGLLLQDTDSAAAADVMERVRAEVGHLCLPRVPGGQLRASFGVAELVATDMMLEDMVARADEALYAAKKQGKDRVNIARSAA